MVTLPAKGDSGDVWPVTLNAAITTVESSATAANVAATAAGVAAAAAQDTADTALNAATTAQGTATSAASAASTASANAAEAQSTANSASSAVATAQSTANSAATAAGTAQTTANAGVSDAAAAQSTANTAVTNAATAQTTANTAVTNAATAQSTANSKYLVGSTVAIPDSTNGKFGRVEIADDGSATAGWVDRFAFYYTHPTNGLTRTGYHNEYGELRARPGKGSTVALRALGHSTDQPTQDVFQVTSSTQGQVYFGVNPSGAYFTVPVTGLSGVPQDYIRTASATAVNNSTTLVTDGVMTATISQNSQAIVEFNIVYDCSAGADFKFRIGLTNGATFVGSAVLLTTAATSSATNSVAVAVRNEGTNYVAGGIGTGSANSIVIPIRGIVTTPSNNSSVITFQYAQSTADASDLVLRDGSFMTVRPAN